VSDWVACTSEPSSLLRWIECHPALGGYIQAIGVFVAILGSGYLTYWSTKRMTDASAREWVGRGRVLVYRLLPPVSDIRATAVRVRRIFQETENGFLLAASGKLEEAKFAFSIDAQVPSDVLSEMYVLDAGTAEEVAKLYYYLSQFNEFVRLNVPHLRELDGEERHEFITTFDTLLSTVEMLSESAVQKLQSART
jgi:hypothetical protein